MPGHSIANIQSHSIKVRAINIAQPKPITVLIQATKVFKPIATNPKAVVNITEYKIASVRVNMIISSAKIAGKTESFAIPVAAFASEEHLFDSVPLRDHAKQNAT